MNEIDCPFSISSLNLVIIVLGNVVRFKKCHYLSIFSPDWEGFCFQNVVNFIKDDIRIINFSMLWNFYLLKYYMADKVECAIKENLMICIFKKTSFINIYCLKRKINSVNPLENKKFEVSISL